MGQEGQEKILVSLAKYKISYTEVKKRDVINKILGKKHPKDD
jgi:hypothetical protein